MNKGIELARGEYIGIVESDDFASLNMFETLYKEAAKNDLDVVRSNYYAIVRGRIRRAIIWSKILLPAVRTTRSFIRSIIRASLCASLQFGQAFIKNR